MLLLFVAAAVAAAVAAVVAVVVAAAVALFNTNTWVVCDSKCFQ